MAPVTTHYGIPDPVPFLDVDIAIDNRMFVDPHAIRLHGDSDPFAKQANERTQSYLEEVIQCVLTGNEHRGLQLLQNFPEPWETRLGLARHGFSGRGGADDVGSWMWHALTTDINALVQVGLLRQIEDLPLFVEGIGRDITSDITTRLIFEPLAKFTSHMIDTYPQFQSATHRIGTFQCHAWDTSTRGWAMKSFQLPIAGDKPLLLVPSSWTRPTLLMSATRYYETAVLSYAQEERAVKSSTGTLLKTPKEKLMTEPGLKRGRATNLNVTRQAHQNNADLIADFKQFVGMKWTKPESPSGAAA